MKADSVSAEKQKVEAYQDGSARSRQMQQRAHQRRGTGTEPVPVPVPVPVVALVSATPTSNALPSNSTPRHQLPTSHAKPVHACATRWHLATSLARIASLSHTVHLHQRLDRGCARLLRSPRSCATSIQSRLALAPPPYKAASLLRRLWCTALTQNRQCWPCASRV